MIVTQVFSIEYLLEVTQITVSNGVTKGFTLQRNATFLVEYQNAAIVTEILNVVM